MHLLRISIIVCILQTATAQVIFCPPGAQWHYGFAVFTPFAAGAEAITYVRDSVIGAETVKVLSHNKFFKSFNYSTVSSATPLTLIKQKGDTVFMRNRITQHTWKILYNFNASPGDSWQNTLLGISGFNPNSTVTITHTVVVDSVGTVTENNFTLKTMFVRYLHTVPNPMIGIWADTLKITERFGCSGFLFNFDNIQWASDGDRLLGPLCYQDSTFGLKQFSERLCDYSLPLAEEERWVNPYNLSVFPNPGQNIFYLTMANIPADGKLNLDIKELSGRIVKQINLDPSVQKHEIDLKTLSNGIYMMTLRKEQVPLYNARLIKQD